MGEKMEYIFLEDLIEHFDLEIISKSTDYDEIKIFSPEVSRTGLQLIGHFEKFEPKRVQVIGNAEWEYLRELDSEKLRLSMKRFLSFDIPVLVFTSGNKIFDEIIEMAISCNVTIVRTAMKTSNFLNRLTDYMERTLAPSTNVHGVLVEVYDLGVLLIGESGTGKSETALDLITRGHKLISDDVVVITQLNDILLGTSPEITRHFMEIRGIGIIDIEKLYSINSVKHTSRVALVIELEAWKVGKEYDRTGLEEEYIKILGIELPKITIPVKPGRNTALIVEVGARNYKQKSMGYNPLDTIAQRTIEVRKNKKMKKYV